MTFVAQPYERFVDDLLTALTGGVSREEHRFVGPDEPYSLASPGATNVKVFGQRNEAFVLFEPGIDYQYDPQASEIHWKPDGRLPDDHSFFYVNYDTQEAPRRLTDRNPGSVTTTLAEALARECAVLHKEMEMIYRSAFVALATGSALDHVVALLGLTRKDAKFASGEVLFTRSTPAPGDITIAAGMLVSTDQGQNFETTDKRTLRKGQLSVVEPIRAQVEGPAGRVDAGAIKNINRPVFGIEAVVNERPTFFATQKETDEELRRRLQGTLERAGKATVEAIRYSLIEDLPEVTDNNIQVLERSDVPGLVEVKLGVAATADPDLVRRVEESIFYARPAGVRVVHNLPTRTGPEAAQRAGVEPPPGSRAAMAAHVAAQDAPPATTHLPPEVLAPMPEGVLPLRVEILLRLTEPNLSAAQKESIEDAVRAHVMAYIEALPMGAEVIYNKLLGQIVQPESILDAVLLIGAASDTPVYKTNLATDGRKATIIDANSVIVGLMDEAVFVDMLVQLQLEPQPQNGTRQEVSSEAKLKLQRALQEGGKIHSAVAETLNHQLAMAQGRLTTADLALAIRTTINSDPQLPPLQFLPGHAVALNAEYEETGRVLNNADEVALEDHHVPRLRQLTLVLPGVLDG